MYCLRPGGFPGITNLFLYKTIPSCSIRSLRRVQIFAASPPMWPRFSGNPLRIHWTTLAILRSEDFLGVERSTVRATQRCSGNFPLRCRTQRLELLGRDGCNIGTGVSLENDKIFTHLHMRPPRTSSNVPSYRSCCTLHVPLDTSGGAQNYTHHRNGNICSHLYWIWLHYQPPCSLDLQESGQTAQYRTTESCLYCLKLIVMFEVACGQKIGDESIKRAQFLSSTGPHSYELAKVVSRPDKPRKFTYAQLCVKITARCTPVKSIFVDRETFGNRYQGSSEKFQDYLDDLRALVQPCQFTDEDMALLGQVLRGMRDKEVKKVLLSKPASDLTLNVAAREIIAAESATQHVSIVGSSTIATGSVTGTLHVGHDKPLSSGSLGQISEGTLYVNDHRKAQGHSSPTPPPPVLTANSCIHCGNPNKHNCPKANYTCFFCWKKGHIAPVCPLKLSGGERLPQPQSLTTPSTVRHSHTYPPRTATRGWTNTNSSAHHLTQLQQPQEQGEACGGNDFVTTLYYMPTLDGIKAPPPIVAKLIVEGHPLEMEVDCGAGHSVISYAKFLEHFAHVPLVKPNLTLFAFGGRTLRIVGKAEVQVETTKNSCRLPLLVVHEQGPCLLGRWTSEHDKSINHVKNVLSTAALTHYSTELPLILACDASPHGVGAVISHIMPNGEEKPIAFGSKTLKSSEQNYSHVDKEALAVVFGVRKFYYYLAGRKFTIITDSKPVVGIFNPTKSISENLSPRMLRWRLYLNNFDFTIQHKKGMLHTNADFFSRMPMNTTGTEPLFPEPAGVLLLEEAPKSSVLNSESIAAESKSDPIISKVIDGLIHGRDYSAQDPNLTNYTGPPGLFTVLHGCLLKGNRVVVPLRLRSEVLARLHRVHQGIVRTKSLARSYQLRRRWHEGHKTLVNPNVELVSNELDISVSRYNDYELAQESELQQKIPEVPNTNNGDLATEMLYGEEPRKQIHPESEEPVEMLPAPELNPLLLETQVFTPSKGLPSRVIPTRNRKPPAYLKDYTLK
ncbi:hypothetical protein B566_EDAN016988 [Ephemera danica]|nr:hypothetical protein B566_EDAN016988 [Ephemera danica]